MQTPTIERLLERIGHEKRIHYSLDHFTEALSAAGSPHKNVKTIVIAGTNGKGGTTHFISAGLISGGYRVATYLSPHLQSVTERFLMNLTPISKAELDELAVETYPWAEKFRLTYFEFLTLIFFRWVERTRPDYVVLEVGMGGKQDATNVTEPLATVLTNIDWDHQAYLGDTLEKILEEKMGIFRKKTPIFTTEQNPSLLPILRERARMLQCPLYEVPDPPPSQEVNWTGQTLTLEDKNIRIVNPTHGSARNAALSWKLLRELFPQIPSSHLAKAFSRTSVAGRMELVRRKPNIVLSGDHNPAGLTLLCDLLPRLKDGPLHIVAGFSLDKPYREMFAALKPVASRIWLTQVPGTSPPADYQNLQTVISDPKLAVKEALSQLPPEGTLLITGSLYLVGAVRELFTDGTTVASFLAEDGRFS